MGVYYLIHCPQKREYIDPGRVGRGGIKRYAIVHGSVANLAMHALASGRWSSIEVVGDEGDLYDEIKQTQADVTEELVSDFNETWPEQPAIRLLPPAPDSEPPPKGEP
jgi:hypothetical protein